MLYTNSNKKALQAARRTTARGHGLSYVPGNPHECDWFKALPLDIALYEDGSLWK